MMAMLLEISEWAFPGSSRNNKEEENDLKVFDKVKELILMQLPVSEDKVTLDARLVDDLGADSANLMMLIMDLESEYDMTVEDDALGTIKTVGDIVNYIESKKA